MLFNDPVKQDLYVLNVFNLKSFVLIFTQLAETTLMFRSEQVPRHCKEKKKKRQQM